MTALARDRFFVDRAIAGRRYEAQLAINDAVRALENLYEVARAEKLSPMRIGTLEDAAAAVVDIVSDLDAGFDRELDERAHMTSDEHMEIEEVVALLVKIRKETM